MKKQELYWVRIFLVSGYINAFKMTLEEHKSLGDLFSISCRRKDIISVQGTWFNSDHISSITIDKKNPISDEGDDNE